MELSPREADTNNPQAAFPSHFDAKAQQRVPIKVEYEGEFYVVEHIFDPYDNEDRLADYAERCKTTLRSGEVKGSVDRETDSFEANVWLWNKLAVGIIGMGDGGEELPDDWKERVDDEDKDYAIQQLLATDIVPLATVAKESGKSLPWGYKTTTSLVQLRARFGAYQVVLGHYMKKANPGQLARFQKLRSQSRQVPGSRLNHADLIKPMLAREYGKLYKELKESVTGYVDDIVPLNHQMDIVIYHLSGGQEGVIKN